MYDITYTFFNCILKDTKNTVFSISKVIKIHFQLNNIIRNNDLKNNRLL